MSGETKEPAELENPEQLYLPLQAKRRLFNAELKVQAENPLGDDPIMANFFGVYSELQQTDEGVSAVTNYLLSKRPELRPSVAAHTLLRSFQFEWFDGLAFPGYPYNYDSPDTMRAAIIAVVYDPHRSERLRQNVRHHLKSNIDDRYVSVDLILKWLNHLGRFDENSFAVDYGASMDYGYTRLFMNALDYASARDQGRLNYQPPGVFGPIEVVCSRKGRPGSDELETDEENTERLAKVLASPPVWGRSLSIDEEDKNDPEVHRLALSHSFYPIELITDVDRLERYGVYDQMPPNPRHHFQVGDLLHTLGQERTPFATIVTAFTMQYLYPPAQRRIINENLINVLRHDGLLLKQEFARLKSGQLAYYERFNGSWRYRTFAVDMQDPKKREQELFIWDSGRPRRLQLGLGKLCFKSGETTTFQEFLEDSAA